MLSHDNCVHQEWGPSVKVGRESKRNEFSGLAVIRSRSENCPQGPLAQLVRATDS